MSSAEATLCAQLPREPLHDELVLGDPERGHSDDVLHDQVARAQLLDEADELEDERVPQVLGVAVAGVGEALAGRPTHDDGGTR